MAFAAALTAVSPASLARYFPPAPATLPATPFAMLPAPGNSRKSFMKSMLCAIPLPARPHAPYSPPYVPCMALSVIVLRNTASAASSSLVRACPVCRLRLMLSMCFCALSMAVASRISGSPSAKVYPLVSVVPNECQKLFILPFFLSSSVCMVWWFLRIADISCIYCSSCSKPMCSGSVAVAAGSMSECAALPISVSMR